MPIPDKLIWPAFPASVIEDPGLRRYLADMQEMVEGYLRALQTDLTEVTHGDVGLVDQWGDSDFVYYDKDGILHFHVDGVEVLWFDWAGNLHRNVNIDNLTTNLTKTNSRQLYTFDKETGTIDIFHSENQVMEISSGEIIIDNAFAFKTGQTLDVVTSLNWIDEAVDASGALTTFMSVKGHRVLEVKGTDVKISGALKVA